MNEQRFNLKSWAEDDKPREKLINKGSHSLSDAELLAIIIGSGSKTETAVDLSKRILKQYNNSLTELSRKNIRELMQFRGIGQVKAISIVACLELSRRKQSENLIDIQKINSSKTAFEIMCPIIGDLNHEEFWVMYLNNSNKIISKKNLSKGGFTGTLVDIRILFKTAIEHQSIGIILFHNHPSGKLDPSPKDIDLTKKIKEAGDLLDITLLDHIIIGTNKYFSFADENLI